jgi:hypothetical protein
LAYLVTRRLGCGALVVPVRRIVAVAGLSLSSFPAAGSSGDVDAAAAVAGGAG